MKLNVEEQKTFKELMKSGTAKQAKQVMWYNDNKIYETDFDRKIFYEIIANTFKANE